MNEIREIYKEAFGESPLFDLKFFGAFGSFAKTLKRGGEVVSVLFLLPCSLDGKMIYYIYAAATKKSERGKGYMSKLIKQVMVNTDAPLFLKPATEDLIPFYKSLGFYTAKGKVKNGDKKITVLKTQRELSALLDPPPEEFTLMFSYDTDGQTFEFPYIMQ